MPSSHDKQEFLAAVCSQIRFKGAHKKIANELSDHIEDQTNQYIALGMDAVTAAFKAVEQMGDPVTVGIELDNTHRPKPEWSILSLGAVLVALGCIIQYMLTQISPDIFGSFSYVMMYMLVGIAVFFVVYFFGCTLIIRLPKALYVVFLAFILLGFLFFTPINGSRTYLYYLSLLFIPVFASLVHSMQKRSYWSIVLAGFAYAVPALICLAAPCSVGFFFMTLSCLILLTYAISTGSFAVNKKAAYALLYIPVVLIAIACILYIFDEGGYRVARFFAVLDPMGAGYAFNQVRAIVASALPFSAAPHSAASNLLLSSDLSLTYILYHFGYIPAITLTLLLAALIGRMFTAVRKIKNRQASFLALSVCVAIAVQSVFYALSNFGVIAPFSAVLPFLSFGAFGFVTNMALLGLLLSVYRKKDLIANAVYAKGTKLFTLSEGKLIVDFGLGSFKKMELPK